jgi:hypothetical protein
MTGCKKPTRQYYYIMEETKKYAVFQKGSYWIYQKDSSLIIDSIYVDSLENGFKNKVRDEEIVESMEYIHCITKSSLYDNFQIIYKLQAQDNINSMCNYEFNYDNDPDNTTWTITTFLNMNGFLYTNATTIQPPTDSTYQDYIRPK